jgi:hypothetical protein
VQIQIFLQCEVLSLNSQKFLPLEIDSEEGLFFPLPRLHFEAGSVEFSEGFVDRGV